MLKTFKEFVDDTVITEMNMVNLVDNQFLRNQHLMIQHMLSQNNKFASSVDSTSVQAVALSLAIFVAASAAGLVAVSAAASHRKLMAKIKAKLKIDAKDVDSIIKQLESAKVGLRKAELNGDQTKKKNYESKIVELMDILSTIKSKMENQISGMVESAKSDEINKQKIDALIKFFTGT